MGLLDDVIGRALPGGAFAKPIIIALGSLLLHQMLKPSESTAHGQAAPPLSPPADDGGLLGGLGGLLEKFRQGGHQDAMNSWIGTGPNKPIEPGPLGTVLGQQTIGDLARQSGMSEQDLLNALAKALPQVVNGLTPNGRLPTVAELGGA